MGLTLWNPWGLLCGFNDEWNSPKQLRDRGTQRVSSNDQHSLFAFWFEAFCLCEIASYLEPDLRVIVFFFLSVFTCCKLPIVEPGNWAQEQLGYEQCHNRGRLLVANQVLISPLDCVVALECICLFPWLPVIKGREKTVSCKIINVTHSLLIWVWNFFDVWSV